MTAYGMQESTMDKFDSSLEVPRKAGIKQGLLSGLTIGATSGEPYWSLYIAMRMASDQSSNLQVYSPAAMHWQSGTDLGKLQMEITPVSL